MPRLLVLGFAVWMLSTFATPLAAEDWPGWRGPRGDGSSNETGVPIQWSGSENVVWKVPLPGKGHASPIVSGDRVLTVDCRETDGDRLLICLNRKTGKKLWQQRVVQCPLEMKHTLNSYASSTPCTDGKLIYVAFLDADQARSGGRGQPTPGDMVVAAYDFDGKQLWQSRPGRFSSKHGFCSSPVIYQDLLIVNGDHDGDSYIVALDRATGETKWKVPRAHKTRSYCVPLVRRIDGRDHMMLSGSKRVTSYDPATGALRWFIEGPTEQFVASLVYGDGLIFLTCGYPERHLMAIDPRGKGDVTETHVVWHERKGASYVPSPIAVGGYFLVVADNGIASCFEATSGRRTWMERLGRHYSASLVTAEGRAFFLDDDGITKVVVPGEKLEVTAINELGEACYASPAISGGQWFIRGEKHLFCIGRQSAE